MSEVPDHAKPPFPDVEGLDRRIWHYEMPRIGDGTLPILSSFRFSSVC